MMSKLDLKALTVNPPKLHQRGGELISDWRIDDATCYELDRRLSPTMKTVETGAGLSTIIFATNGCQHTCIMPERELADRIVAYCRANNISTDHVDFIISKSTDVIHQLQPGYDLALIDGTHGFPAAIVDFYYATKLLKIGGTLIIDDMHIFTCSLIASFMREDAGWNVEMFTNRVAFGTKIADTIDAEWINQPFVTNKGAGRATFRAALRRSVTMLRHEGIGPTMAKIAERVRRT
jgi:hypothetical protein